MSDGEDLNVIRVEVAHHFGISAERLVEIDRRRRGREPASVADRVPNRGADETRQCTLSLRRSGGRRAGLNGH
jgi:hypothetical protein